MHGVDLNPYAVAIARFRLLLGALKECGVTRLKDAPGFEIAISPAVIRCCMGALEGISFRWDGARSTTFISRRIGKSSGGCCGPKAYHAVVANPPYITPKDRGAQCRRIASDISTCHRQYSLAVPFLERIVSLAVDGGFTGQITANSFMKREFGKKLIEEFFPRVDLTHVIDTSGAYIPGHGTPTVILFARNRRPVASTLRTVMGIRGEPSTPDDPAHGLGLVGDRRRRSTMPDRRAIS